MIYSLTLPMPYLCVACMSASDKRAAIKQLAVENFDERERLRLEAAEQLSSQQEPQS